MLLEEEVTLRQCDGAATETPSQKYRLRSACLHRGSKADFGHYVAVYKDEESKQWVLCNDSKVVDMEDVPTGESYLVFYERE